MVPAMMPSHHKNRVTQCHVSPVTSRARLDDRRTFHPVGAPTDSRTITDPRLA